MSVGLHSAIRRHHAERMLQKRIRQQRSFQYNSGRGLSPSNGSILQWARHLLRTGKPCSCLMCRNESWSKRTRRERLADFNEQDAKALAAHWQAVWDDMRKALDLTQ